MSVGKWIAKISGRGEIDCPEVRNLSFDYLEDDLPPETQTKVQAHLGVCPSCTASIKSLASTISLLGRLPRSQPPPSLKRNIREQFDKKK